MTETWEVIVALVLLACASMYLGTGWSLVLFSFPLAPSLTPQTYALPLVEPVHNATRFFTWMTMLMIVAAIALIGGAWDSGYAWAPAVYLAATVAATALTMIFIFPYNREMTAGIGDDTRLHLILGKWMRLNLMRTLLWTVEWIAIALFFAFQVA